LFKLLRGVRALCPEDRGKVDILLAFDRIAYIGTGIHFPQGFEVEEFDCNGMTAIPGLIDGHVHICGGGGEGGPQTRTPEISLSELTSAGITTVVGCLGTDAVTRSMAGLLAKAKGLEVEGISTYIYSGAYQVPTRTILNTLREDLALIEKVVGAGEIAISDHRSAQPHMEELAKLAAEARVGGMLGGKAGVVHIHLGEGQRGMLPINRILEETEIPITQFVPTHVNRNRRLFQQGLEFLERGGRIDLTAGGDDLEEGVKIPEALAEIFAKGLVIENVTVSSDGNGSLPLFDQQGNLTGLAKGSVQVLWQDLAKTVLQTQLSLEQVVQVVTSNVAKVLKLVRKGRLEQGYDADLVLLDAELKIQQVFAKGRLMVDQGQPIVFGTFEAGQKEKAPRHRMLTGEQLS
jgi:beta-aspartyl-dipeptidase (metallo-type)